MFVTFEGCHAVHETEKVPLVFVPDLDGEEWMPKAAIHDNSEVYKADTSGDLVVKSWFAQKQGWEP